MNLSGFFRKKSVIISLIVIFLAGVSGLVIGLYLYNERHEDLQTTEADYVMRAGELVAEFLSDEASATEKYVNKVIEIKGQVTWAEFGIADSTLSLTLREGKDLAGVICTFNGVTDKSRKLVEQGDSLTVRGVCAGMLMDILLNNCVIVKD